VITGLRRGPDITNQKVSSDFDITNQRVTHANTAVPVAAKHVSRSGLNPKSAPLIFTIPHKRRKKNKDGTCGIKTNTTT